MNKKLVIAAATAGLVLPFAAHADVKVYGAAQVEHNFYSNDAAVGAPVQGKDGTFQEDNARGRIGVWATEDLGGGMKGLARWEWKVDTTDNVDNDAKGLVMGSRESMVGLKGGFGTIMLGKLKQPYKYTGGVKYDPFVATTLQARGNGGMSAKAGLDNSYGHNAFMNKAIGYQVKAGGGLSVWVNYRLDEGAGGQDDGGYSAAVAYENGPIHAFLALNDDDDAAGVSSYSATKLGGSFKSGAMKFLLQYEMINDTTDNDSTVLFLGGQFKMGKNLMVLQIGQTDIDGVADTIDYTALGLIHKFSKSTRAWIGWRSVSDKESVVSIGVRKDFKS